MSVFKACDIRGAYPDELDERFYASLGKAMGTLLRRSIPRPNVLVGGDVRHSTPALQRSLVDGLSSTGCAIADLGVVPTPVVYFAARRLRPDGLAIVTASHNPPAHNGLKLCLGPMPITVEQMSLLEHTLATGDFATGQGEPHKVSVRDDYVAWLQGTASAGHGLRIVLDGGNGTYGQLAPEVLRSVGYEVDDLFCTPDGSFPNRSPNPSIPAHLTALCQRVWDTHAPVGVALDGDGDRVAIVDDRGRTLTGDQAIILLARHVLGADGGGSEVVCDLKCSQAVMEAIASAGGTPVLERSGHAFIKRRMMVDSARFGGELSGHFFYRELDGGDDALYSILRIAELVAALPGPLSAAVDALPKYPITRDIRIPYDRDDGDERIEALAAAAGGDVLRLDGVRVAYPDGWALARCSVTEPLLTFRFESYRGEPRAIAERFLAPVPDLRDDVLAQLGTPSPE